MLLDVDGIILDINHAAAGLTIEGVIGTPIFQYMDEDNSASAASCLKSVWETGQPASYETTFQVKEGVVQFFETKVALFEENGARVGLLAESRDITVLHQTMSDYKTQTEALNQSQQLANIGSWDLETATGNLSWSDQVYEIFGLSSAEFKATYEAFLESIHPDDREMVNKAYSEAVANKTLYDVVHRVLRPDGSVRVVRETSRDLLDSSGEVERSLGIVHDITDQHTIQKALEEKERFLSTLVANVPGLVYRCLNSPDWPMEYLSPGCFELTGYHPSELMVPSSRTFSSIIHPEDSQKLWADVQKALDDKVFFELTYRIITAQGKERWVWERGQGIYDQQGEVLAIEGFLTDYSKIKFEQKNRLDLERKVMENQKLESLGLMAGGIAHDFNNLLTIILGNANLALEDILPTSPVRDYLRKIEIASQRASDLAYQMLAYSGHSQFVIEAIDINDLLLEMTQMMEISISRTGSLAMELGDDLPRFEGDVTQVRQVVMNLISNASESVEDLHATIKVSSGSMWCDRAYLDGVCATHLMRYEDPVAEGQYVFFEVTDTGSGMDSEILDRIFDPFFTTKFTGRGLGLAATLGIIRGHRGTLLVTSKPGMGTTFKVLFPSSEKKSSSTSTSESECTDKTWLGSGLVLYADDEVLVRDLGQAMLVRMGFEVIAVPDGKEAVRQFKNHAEEIALVLLDLTMPHMNGVEAFREISAHNPETKVILCSGFTENEANLDEVGAKFSGYLHKPFTMAELLREIKKVLC